MNKVLKNSWFKKVTSMFPVKKLLYSRVVLYILCILALVNLVMYANVKDFNSVITLLMTGFLVSFFSKNMIIILGVAIGVTYVLNYTSTKMFTEGAENMNEDENTDEDIVDDEESSDKKPKKDTKKKEDAEKEEDDDDDDEKEEFSEGGEKVSEDKQKIYDNLQNDFKDFEKVQNSILSGMQEIDPLLQRAESFIEKFEHYGNMLEKDK